MDARIKEAIRYLGYGKHAADDGTLTLIQESFGELEQTAGARSICRIFESMPVEDGSISIGELLIHSKSLYKNMEGCTRAALIGATLGAGVDMLMRRYSVMDMTKAVVLGACASALLEEYLDGCWQDLEEKLMGGEEYLRPRFSPGYGDFDIQHQKGILRMLDAAKQIGLSMTDSYMLTPVKSVTAVMGIGSREVTCHQGGCERCGKQDCTYRRNTGGTKR